MNIRNRLRQSVRNFSDDHSGNFAITFAICAFAMFGVIGAAVDYSRVSRSQSAYQQAADAAALEAAIQFRTKPWGQAKVAGRKMFESTIRDLTDTRFKDVEIKNEDDAIIVVAKGESDNFVLPLFGFSNLDFRVKSVVKVPDFPVEVSLVLDTTFSMSAGGKIQGLKNAATEFVDTLLSANNNSDIKISIVPFAQYVNVGRSSMGQSWLDAQDEVVNVPEQCSMQRDLISKSGCTTSTTNHPKQWVDESCSPAQYSDGVMVSPASCTPGHWQEAYSTSSETCSNYQYGDPYEVCQPPYSYNIDWNGCVGSRNYPLNLQDKSFNQRVPGPNQLTCPSEITPLTDRKNKLKQAINALTPVGNTYIPAGIAWGTRTLSSQAPYKEAKSDAAREAQGGKRFLVVMTDGVNSVSANVPSDPLHTGSDTDQADDWTVEACNNAKAEDITVYTVSFGTDVNNDTKLLLRNCASKPVYYFDAETNNGLNDAFSAIADSILTVYLYE
ncbi:MAG: pilus assembly protein TadG-related protein [Rhizobiaceae bacterium]